MTKEADIGHPEAHTRAAASPDALGGADVDQLLAGSPDLDATDLLALAAEPVLSGRRARGRPEGALNRKNNDMIAYLRSLGHRDPWVTLSLIQSADTMQLAKLLGADAPKLRVAVLELQRKAADTLMSYHHAKKPVQLELPGGDSKRPMMVIGELNVAIGDAATFMSAGMQPVDIAGQSAKVVEASAEHVARRESHGEGK